MTLFWLLAALVAVAALMFLLLPRRRRAALPRSTANVAIYRDQLRELDADLAAGTLSRADHERSRAELEARLLQDASDSDVSPPRSRPRAMVLIAGAAVPLAALAVYLAVGNPGAVNREVELQVSAAQVQAMVERLAARLRENPDDVKGWKLLGRSYSVLGRYAEAADAYAKAAVRAPRDAELLTDLGEALAMARGQTLQGEPEKLVLRALEIDPENLKALALAGTAAFERKDFGQAAAYWKRMLPLLPRGSEEARSVEENIEQARALDANRASGVSGTVSLAPQLKAQASPEDVVFVFARAADGPPMPLAVAKTRVRELPYRFRLDDSMAMTPTLKLSAFPKVVVTARVSKTGTATAQPGDLQGSSAAVANDATTVTVVIDTLVR